VPRDVWERLGQRLRAIAREEAHDVAGRPTRWRVVVASPVRLASMAPPDAVLEEGEEDFDVAHGLDLAVGDVVLVVEDHHGDFTAVAVVRG
jgi:hypothetical protein